MLKRFISFILLGVMISLLLGGCNSSTQAVEATLPTEATTEPTHTTLPPTTAPPPTTLPPETTVPAQTQPVSTLFGSPMGGTDGALRSLSLNMGAYCRTYPLGDTVLLCIPQEGRYQIRSLHDGSVLAKKNNANWANDVTVTDDLIIYYSLTTHKITFLNRNLEVVKTLDFTLDDTVADMLFSDDGNKAYYCKDQHTVVELDLATFEERLIPVYGPPIWALTELHLNDSVLRFWGKEEGNDYYGFIKLDTGAYLGKDTNMTKLQDWDNNYFITRAYQGTIERLVVLDGSHRYMVPKDHGKRSSYSAVVPQLNSFFTLSYNYDSPEVILDLYDLTTKQRTSSITANIRFESCSAVFADPSGEYIWLSLKTGKTPNYQMVLYRWDFRTNTIEDATVYGYGG